MSDPQHQERIMRATASASPTVGTGYIARMPRGVRKALEWLLVAMLVGLIVFQLYTVRKSVLDAALAAQPPIEFMSEWVPDKEVYAPGEAIRLTYTRRTFLPPGEREPIMALSLDAFENITNGEVYGGAIIGRVIDKASTVNRTAVRRIPIECSDGEYVFEGWMLAQTYRRSVPVWYQSKPFRVERPK